ncbi:RNase adapter RapZ [Bifidobacterium callitrichidarum]|uniref:RNase adapter RapZ n=1 Tax=Bifidobacterium callitrichidarum TaxID=2052941 RepID=A0A2U2NCE3_9BIFI|nr:RNase adapter RapZ [Bifidobacterium callitrichidarum]PWG66815.1 RNase adapter RapZ [Bifidobacterium callitrichidarum]
MDQQTPNRNIAPTGDDGRWNQQSNTTAQTRTDGDATPNPLDSFEVLLITGMSGAGRSHAADCVEDMGWYVVDNLPPKLLVPLVDMMTTSGKGGGVHKLAAVIDVRSRSYFDDLAAVLGHLDDLGVKTRILFLDASNEVLIKRYESVRRPHPLQHGNRLIDGIKEERQLLVGLKERADWVIDTSKLSIHQLSTRLYEAMLGSGPTTVAVHIFSFGFKYGMPIDADFVADVRFLPNPFWVPSLRELTGRDKPVADYVLSSKGAKEFLDSYEKAIEIALEGYAQEDKHYVTIAIGCTGGQHRSVAMSEELARRLRAHGLNVTVSAREQHKTRSS